MRKAFVIAIGPNPQSMAAANRCIKSAAKFGIEVNKFQAITPGSKQYTENLNWLNQDGFNEVYSRKDRCMAAFLSHHELWKWSVVMNQEIIILEHDAVFMAPIPDVINHNGVISLGQPSYGKFNTPLFIGVNMLTSKPYFPGAHAYIVNPKGANELLQEAEKRPKPTDIFLNSHTFPWLQEYYPWPVKADDSFTTIQTTRGCLAKHNYGEAYKII